MVPGIGSEGCDKKTRTLIRPPRKESEPARFGRAVKCPYLQNSCQPHDSPQG